MFCIQAMINSTTETTMDDQHHLHNNCWSNLLANQLYHLINSTVLWLRRWSTQTWKRLLIYSTSWPTLHRNTCYQLQCLIVNSEYTVPADELHHVGWEILHHFISAISLSNLVQFLYVLAHKYFNTFRIIQLNICLVRLLADENAYTDHSLSFVKLKK